MQGDGSVQLLTLPEDESFREVCTDVAIRFRGHGAYQDRDGALKAFRRRAPGHETETYAHALDYACGIYDLAVSAISLFPRQNHRPGKYADTEDIDVEKCMQYLEEIYPDGGLAMRRQILHWVIFWHYLK